MEVDLETAILFYNKINYEMKFPSLHPYYTVIDAQRSIELEPKFFVYQEGDSVWLHSFHIVKIENTNFYDLQSPYGYGGPISNSESNNFIKNANKSYSDWCAKNGIVVEFIRFHPVLENWRYYESNTIKKQETVWVDLTKNYFENYEKRTKSAIKKFQKNEFITLEYISKESYMNIFPKFYNNAMKNISAEDKYFFNDNYHVNLSNWENVYCIACKYLESLIGISLFMIEGKSSEYHLSASNELGRQMGANTLILHESFSYAKLKGCSRMHLGGGTNLDLDNSLLLFKKGFSGLRTQFRIGFKIYNEEYYSDMKELFELKNDVKTDKIIFYR